MGVRRMKLGSQGLEVSCQGLGCASMSIPPRPEHDMIALIHHAIDSGVTFLDTSDCYGPFINEILLGKALKGGMREKVQLATKFGVTILDDFKLKVHGDPAYVRACCEASLKRLDVDYIDLYYQHRIDPQVPIELTMGELKKLVEEGKIKYIGLSEASASTIRRAHAVHPITAVQMEWSLWSRDIEEEIVPTCRELGIGIVAYSPLGRGFFSLGPKLVENFSEDDYRKGMPRFLPENFEHNKHVFERVSEMAARKGCTPAQLALAWVHHRGDDVVPIPATTKLKNLNDNIKALSLELTADEMAELESFATADKVKGHRNFDNKFLWDDTETPLLSSCHCNAANGWRQNEYYPSEEDEAGVPRPGSVSSRSRMHEHVGILWAPKPEDEMIALISHAISSGITFLDTSDWYGPWTNEILLGKALKGGWRDKVQLATKFGVHWTGKVEIRGDPEYVRAACEGSLKRLDVDCIDLYYQHRADTRVPIEVTMGELKKLVEEGKIKYIGLSEVSPSTIRRAHAVHPVTAVQLEWSLWSRDVEKEIVPTCRELGIGIVVYSPLGRGFLSSGPKMMENFTKEDYRQFMPRFQPENVEHNKAIFERVTELASRKGCTPAQLALAWVHHQGADVCPIPGTTKPENLNQNIRAMSLKLTPEDMSELESLASAYAVKGERYGAAAVTWENSDTPLLSSWKAL